VREAEVARSRPTFKRRLLFASALFTGLFVSDLFMVGHLAFRDLSHRVIDEAFTASLRSLEVPLPLAFPPEAGEEIGAPVFPECAPPGEPQSFPAGAPCRSAPPLPDPGANIFRKLTYRWERIVFDLEGRPIWRESGRRSRVDGELPAPAPRPWHPGDRDTWEVGGEPRAVIAMRQQAGPGGDLVREVGIPAELIDRELAELQRDLQRKLWIGAGVAVLILLVAFLYVLRLLQRTRLLEAQAQMDDRLAYVGGLAAGLAHEIRNPLNVLSINLQMLEEELLEKGVADPKETREYLNTLQGEIRRLGSLANNFLSYARPSQPRLEPKDLNGVLRETCRLVQPDFERKGLRLTQDLSPYLPPVDLDEAQFRQAVMNVLHNATQVLKPGGSVLVESRLGPGGEAIVAIQDDGPGIKPEDRARIFDVFYSGRRGGTGLGLSIAANILQAHGGSIRVEEAPGGGARFVLTLPRRRAAATPPPATPAWVPTEGA
jgi:signal transduction histidine kinase